LASGSSRFSLGEVGGNAVTMALGLGYLLGTAIFAVALLLLLSAQINANRFHPFLYWAVITATTLLGTTLADFFDRSLGIGYLGGSLSLFTMVLATLGLWYWSLGSIAVETVGSPKAEAFYWAAIMFSQTLGTALGDWMADDTGLGYRGSALLIGVVLAVLAVLYFFTTVSRPLLFWAAFILTRPLGATIANSLDKCRCGWARCQRLCRLRRSHHRHARLYSHAAAETGASFGKAGKPHLARGGAAAAHQP
jgi:uncharacterized membrane-anchored protein